MNILSIIGRLIAVVAIACIFLLIGLPFLLSTSWAQGRMLQYVNDGIPGKVSVNEMRFGWLGAQKVEGFTLKDPDGTVVLQIDSLSADISPFELLRNSISPAELQLKGVQAHIVKGNSGSSNLERALGIKASDASSPPYEVSLKDLEGEVHFTGLDAPATLRLSGQTQSGTVAGSFHVDALLRGLSPEQIETLTAKIENFPIVLITQFLAVQDPESAALIRTALGETLQGRIDQKKTAEGSIFIADFTTPTTNAHMEGLLTSDNFKLTQPGTLSLQIVPELTRKLLGAELASPGRLLMTIDQLNVPVENGAPVLSAATLNAQAALDPLSLTTQSGRVVGVHDAKFSLQNSKLSMSAMVQGVGETATPVKLVVSPSPAKAEKGFTMHLDGQLTLDRYPFDFEAAAAGNKLEIVLKGDRVNGRIPLELGDAITLTDAASLQLRVTPERFKAYRRFFRGARADVDDLELVEDALMTATLTELNVPKKDPTQATLKGSVKIDKLKVEDYRTGQAMRLEPITGTFASETVSRDIAFNIEAAQTDRGGNKSTLLVTGLIDNPFVPAELSANVQTKISKLPAGLLCEILCLEPKLRMKMDALLGPLVDIDVDLQFHKMNGPVKARLSGVNGNIQLNGLVQQRVLYLNEPLYVEVKATPELGASVLEDIIPLLGGLLRAQAPLKFTIAKESFALPLVDPNAQNVQIGQLTIDLGYVQFSNEGQLAKIMSALKVTSSDTLDVWFTPIYLSMDQGIIGIQRFDLLAMQSFPIAAWGNVDLVREKIDMTVGLTGKSLQNAVGIAIPDKSYMLQFPIKGSLGHASVDKTKLVAKIAALTASAAGGPHGMVLGAVIGLASGALTEPSPPAPTTQPLPWETSADVADAQEGNQNQAEPQKREKSNPAKALEKGAGNLLKKLFK